MNHKTEKIYSPREVAKLLGYSTKQVILRWIWRGYIKAYRTPTKTGNRQLGRWRIPASEVRRILTQGKPVYEWFLQEINELTEREKGWLEGLIDGEGSLTLHKRKDKREKGTKRRFFWQVSLSIANTNKKLIARVKEVIGAGSVTIYERKNKRYRQAYKYGLSARGLRALLPELKLIVKERQRVLLMRALKLLEQNYDASKDSELERIYQEVRALNRRGGFGALPKDRGLNP